MVTAFDIKRAFEDAFGFAPLNFDVEQIELHREGDFSKLNSPYYITDAKGREIFLPVKLGGVQLPLPVIKLSGQKTIVETPLVNRRGSVKELISIEDYRITIKGIMLGDNGRYPEEQLFIMRDLWERNEALTIENILTDIFLIRPSEDGTPSDGEPDKVVIAKFDPMETKGFKGMIPYQLDLIADQELELIVS